MAILQLVSRSGIAFRSSINCPFWLAPFEPVLLPLQASAWDSFLFLAVGYKKSAHYLPSSQSSGWASKHALQIESNLQCVRRSEEGIPDGGGALICIPISHFECAQTQHYLHRGITYKQRDKMNLLLIQAQHNMTLE